MQGVILADEDTEIDPVSTGQPGGGVREVEIDRLSAIIAEFNHLFWGSIGRTPTGSTR